MPVEIVNKLVTSLQQLQQLPDVAQQSFSNRASTQLSLLLNNLEFFLEGSNVLTSQTPSNQVTNNMQIKKKVDKNSRQTNTSRYTQDRLKAPSSGNKQQKIVACNRRGQQNPLSPICDSNHNGVDRQRATETQPAYKMLVDEEEIKMVKFTRLPQSAAEYNIILLLPGINHENMTVGCGDRTIRVAVNCKNENSTPDQNMNSRAEQDLQATKENENGVYFDTTWRKCQNQLFYCFVLPEDISAEATTAEFTPAGKLRVKCFAENSEISGKKP